VLSLSKTGGVMGVDTVRLERNLRTAIRQGACLDELGEAVSRAVGRVVAHDAMMMTGRSPTEGLAAFGVVHQYEADFLQSVQCLGYRLGAPYGCEVPSRRQMPTVVLNTTGSSANDNAGGHDQALRELFAAYGVGCDLRTPLRDARGVWGTLSLLRAHGGRGFDADDISQVEALAPALAAVLREYVTTGPLTPARPLFPAGVVIVRADHTIRAVTPQVRVWLEQMPHHRRSSRGIHQSHLLGLATQARGHAHDPHLSPAIVVAPAASLGRWSISHAQPLGDGTGDIVITIQPATGRLLLPAFSHWYGLTAREGQILHHLTTGAAPKHIARHLNLSIHTINNHLKAIYRKTGATGREELTAALTS
jgi:DNA-binding CsgD family transcriptional regulator